MIKIKQEQISEDQPVLTDKKESFLSAFESGRMKDEEVEELYSFLEKKNLVPEDQELLKDNDEEKKNTTSQKTNENTLPNTPKAPKMKLKKTSKDGTTPYLYNWNGEMDRIGYIQYYKHLGLLTKEQERELLIRIKKYDDEKAQDILIEHNQLLVCKYAYRKLKKSPGVLTFMDLVQEGNIGMMWAIKKFDLSCGCRFTTYAVPWILQHMERAVEDQCRTIRVPTHVYNKLARIEKFKTQYSHQYHKQPTDEEISNELKYPVKKIKMLYKSVKPISSLDEHPKQITNDKTTDLGSTIQDKRNYFEEFERKQCKLNIPLLLNTLPTRQCALIQYLYGFGKDHKKHTLSDASQKFGLTEARIRQLERDAYKKLKNPAHRQIWNKLFE